MWGLTKDVAVGVGYPTASCSLRLDNLWISVVVSVYCGVCVCVCGGDKIGLSVGRRISTWNVVRNYISLGKWQ